MAGRHKAVYMPFRCDARTAETIQRIATVEHLPVSVVLRDLVQAGLSGKGYDDGTLDQRIRDAVQAGLQAPVERLAAIGAKGTQAAAASFFLSLWLSGRLDTAGPEELEEVAATARQLGIRYLKLERGADVDAYMRQSAAKLQRGD